MMSVQNSRVQQKKKIRKALNPDTIALTSGFINISCPRHVTFILQTFISPFHVKTQFTGLVRFGEKSLNTLKNNTVVETQWLTRWMSGGWM